MMLNKMYDFSKKYLLKTIGIPILILVFLDYVVALSWFVRAGCVMWISFQGLGLMIGIWLGALDYLKADSPWQALPRYHVTKFIPTIAWGKELAVWGLKEDIGENKETKNV